MSQSGPGPDSSQQSASSTNPTETKKNELAAGSNPDVGRTLLTGSDASVAKGESAAASANTAESDEQASDEQALHGNTKINLNLLLPSGKRHSFAFDPSETLADVKHTVFNSWPVEWSDVKPANAASLRIIYFGRYLDDSSTLESSKMEPGETTTAHLHIKSPTPPDDSGQKTMDEVPKCCRCVIL